MSSHADAGTDTKSASHIGATSLGGPIAVIGMGCRFPGGANDPQTFWRLLCDGVDAITEVPEDRWNLRAFYDPEKETPGKLNVRLGGFVDGIDLFDPEFFGIALREAACMDPQQRMMLEVAWEALEDGGEVLEVARESNIGVFVGISTSDYNAMQGTLQDSELVSHYTNLGTSASIVANRISYCLNLSGPSIALDTACSSALSAIHLACRSLWHGDCATALAGGVNAMLSPLTHLSLANAAMLCPDGHCKAFDARANGYVRAEGGGMVLLKPLSQALTDGNPIYAVIRGTAANQDGRSPGITVPSQAAQEAVVMQACRVAGVEPREVSYVEAHGTGTPVGDPIEAHALSAVLCREDRNGNALVVGSVKTNIGHLEAGAGVAGIIKLALMLHHRVVPPNLHFDEPNPNIDFEKLQVRIPTARVSLPQGRVIAGINSFGFGGANAHAVLESAPGSIQDSAEDESSGDTSPTVHLLPLSARSAEVLPEMARRFATFLREHRADGPKWLRDVCYTASLHRVRHENRLMVSASTAEDMAAKLEAFASGDAGTGVHSAHVEKAQKLLLVFSGQGPQWWGMGRQLLAQEPVFRAKILECDRLLRSLGANGGRALWAEFHASEPDSHMSEVAISHWALFSMQVAIAALWRSWGIEPAMVVGHSIGEIAAAHVAGVLSLEDALTVIYHRGRCLEKLGVTGRMLAASVSPPEAESLVATAGGAVSLAAINGPSSVTLSGDGDALEALARELEKRQVFAKFLRVTFPYHSAALEPMREDFIASLKHIQPLCPVIPIISSVTGELADKHCFSVDYWWRNARQSVRFADAMDAAIESGADVALEISAHPVLAASIHECFSTRAHKGVVLDSLRRGEDERATMLSALGKLHATGFPIKWTALFPTGGRCLRLPVYAWKHRRYWQECETHRAAKQPSSLHPLLGRRMRQANPCWESKVEGRVRRMIADHRVQGRIVFPAAGYLEMALACAKQLFDHDSCTVEDVELHKAMILPEGNEPSWLQLSFNSPDSTFQIFSRGGGTQDFWTLHCSGRLSSAKNDKRVAQEPVRLAERCGSDMAHAAVIYPQFEEMGLSYGPRFQGLQKVCRREGEALGWVSLPAQVDDDLYQISPALLDSCFQVMMAVPNSAGPQLYLPARIARLRLYSKPGPEVWCHARVLSQHRGALEMGLRIMNPDGEVTLEFDGFMAIAVERGRGGSARALEDALYEFQWQLQPLDSNGARRPPDYLPSLTDLAARLQDAADHRTPRGWHPKFLAAESDFDQLSASYVVKALGQLGCDLRRGASISEETLRARVTPDHQAVLGRYVNMLEEDGILIKAGKGWTVGADVTDLNPDHLWTAFYVREPGFLPEGALVRLCGRRLAEVLQGQVDALQVLFGDNSFIEQLFTDSATFRPYFEIVKDAVRAVVAALPEGRPIRILEVGAGTGGLTSAVLPELTALPVQQVEYWFTDLSAHFLRKAEQNFHDSAFMRYQTLDLDKSPLEQGFAEHSFDLILASDVLHATTDLHCSLTHIRQLLDSGGWLVALELERPSRWLDLVFGLTKGWWSFTDTHLRPDYPLLSHSQWLQLLQDEGFAEPLAVRNENTLRQNRHVVLLARNPNVPFMAPADAPDAGTSVPAKTWLLFADAHGIAAGLAASLIASGDSCVMVTPGDAYHEIAANHYQIRPAEREDMHRVVDAAASCTGSLHKVVFLWSLDQAGNDEPSLVELSEAQVLGCHTLLTLVQVLAGMDSAPHLSVATRGTQPVGRGRPASVSQSSVWGFGRVVMNEQPRLRCRLIDLSANRSSDEARALQDELCSDDGEEEVALRGSSRYVLRLARSKAARTVAVLPPGSPYRLEIGNSGVLDNLALRPAPRRAPGPGEVEIGIHAAALNFRDVLKALGMYPRELEDFLVLGDECVGRIVAVGEGVDGFQIGDSVIALVPRALGSHVTCDTDLVALCPTHLSLESAVTLPVAYVTAAFALRHVAKMKAGERVLVHSAAGGVGLAVVHMAISAGCEVFATAGNAEKRDFLRVLGVPHVMDSHSLLFADEVMEVTGGEGVDIVVNSLAGEALTRSFGLLRHNGRFIEIGKRDMYGNSKIGLRPFCKGLSFHSVDLFSANKLDHEVVVGLWRQIMAEAAAGKLQTLPLRLFPMTDAARAFRHMMGGSHIGKIVVTLDGMESPAQPLPEPGALRLDSHATYLITGGLGGFGLAVARHLAENGARHLVLTGRHGASTEIAQQTVGELRRQSVNVRVASADIASETDLARLLDDIRHDMPPLRGVIHGAMVVDDGVLLQLDAERFQKVLAPKVLGAWNLHRQTRGEQLDFFVLFSSFSSLVGNPGQASYVSANSFLDCLAHYRQGQGLPAMSINWGPLSEAGYVARHEAVRDSLARAGIQSLKMRPALTMLGRLLQTQLPQIGVIEAQWERWPKYAGSLRHPPRFSSLIAEASADSPAQDSGKASREAILAAKGPERLKLVEAFLCEQAAKVLRTSASSLDMSKPLNQLGLDSLMAVELMNRIESEVGVNVSTGKLMGSPNLATLAAIIGEAVHGTGQSLPAESAAPMAGTPSPGTPDGASLIEYRPLLPRVLSGEVPPVDAATLLYMPDWLRHRTGVSREIFIQQWCQNAPRLSNVLETSLGRIGAIVLPLFASEIYHDQAALISGIIESLELAGKIGARTVSLTALIPSATNYGLAVAEALGDRMGLPAVTTGHAATTAAVVINIENILSLAGRDIAHERVGFLGLGSIGLSTLRLMLRTLPHPAEITLCDLYRQRPLLEKVRQECVEQNGFTGDIHIAQSHEKLAAELYSQSLIIGATNASGVLDIDSLRPGTLIVDDSTPPCFELDAAVRRFDREADILFTNGGMLRSNEPVRELISIPEDTAELLPRAVIEDMAKRDPCNITACILASILSAQFADMKSTLGLVELESATHHLRRIKQLGFTAARLHTEGYSLNPAMVEKFRQRFGGGSLRVEPLVT